MLIYEILQMVRQIRFNRKLYDFYVRAEVEYLINPDTDELHRVHPDYFGGSHNLATAHLENFIPCNNVDYPPVHLLDNGEEVLLYDFLLDELICYQLDKCKYCFPRGDHTARR